MKEVLFSVCAAAVLTAVYKALAPTDKFGAQIKLIAACFFTVTVISAVDSEISLFDLSDILNADTSYNDYSAQLEMLTSDEVSNELRRVIKERLAEENIYPEKIYINVNISDNGSISISEITLVFKSRDFELYSERTVVLVNRAVGTGVKLVVETDTGMKYMTKEREDQ